MDRREKKEKKKKRQQRQLIIILLILIIGVIATTYMVIIKPVLANSYEVINNHKTEKNSQGQIYLKDKLFVIFKDGYDVVDGEKNSSFKFEKAYDEIKIDKLGENLLISDPSSGTLLIVDETGALTKKEEINHKIMAMKIDEMNYIGIQIKKNDEDILIIYDKNLERIKDINIKEDAKIIEFGFNSEKNVLGIATISHEEEIETSIIILDMAGRRKETVDFNGEIISSMFIDDNGDLLCISDKKIFKMSRKGEIYWERETDISKIGYDAFNDSLVICQYQQEKTNLFILNNDNKIILETQIDFQVTHIKSKKDKILLYGQLYISEIRNSKMKTTKMGREIINAEILEDNQLSIEDIKKVVVVKAFL